MKKKLIQNKLKIERLYIVHDVSNSGHLGMVYWKKMIIKHTSIYENTRKNKN